MCPILESVHFKLGTKLVANFMPITQLKIVNLSV